MIEFTPTSSWAVPVTMNVVVGMTEPCGPEMPVVGVSSVRPNVSNFFVCFVTSRVPFVANARDQTWYLRLPANWSWSDQSVVAAPGEASVALIVFEAPHVTRSSWSQRREPRSWISSWTRLTPPVAVAVPWIWNGTPDSSTRPSIGLVIVERLVFCAGTVLKS